MHGRFAALAALVFATAPSQGAEPPPGRRAPVAVWVELDPDIDSWSIQGSGLDLHGYPLELGSGIGVAHFRGRAGGREASFHLRHELDWTDAEEPRQRVLVTGKGVRADLYRPDDGPDLSLRGIVYGDDDRGGKPFALALKIERDGVSIEGPGVRLRTAPSREHRWKYSLRGWRDPDALGELPLAVVGALLVSLHQGPAR